VNSVDIAPCTVWVGESGVRMVRVLLLERAELAHLVS